eukprot:1188761-Prorocentrum_minimum.AAC.2
MAWNPSKPVFRYTRNRMPITSAGWLVENARCNHIKGINAVAALDATFLSFVHASARLTAVGRLCCEDPFISVILTVATARATLRTYI